MYDREPVSDVPSGMYEGGCANSSQAIKVTLEHFGIMPPSILYYPGSSSDVSLIGVEGLKVIHADNSLIEQEFGGFALLGAEVHAVDVHVWEPEEIVDAIAFINPSGINAQIVAERVNLHPDGIILYAGWLPRELVESEEFDMVAVLVYGAEINQYKIETDALSEYINKEKVASFYVFKRKQK